MHSIASKSKKTNPKIHSGVGKYGVGVGWAPGASALDPFCAMTGLRPTQAEM